MHSDKLIETLKSTLLFSDLDNTAMQNLKMILFTSKYSKRNILFHENDPAETLYILASGRVDLVKTSANGREQLIRMVKPGEIFAEAAMFSGTNYPVTAIVQQESSLVYINKNHFLDFIKKHPEVSLKIMGTMADLLRHLNTLVFNLSLEPVEKRLARYILNLAENSGTKRVVLKIRKHELAFQLGTANETLSRNLKKLVSKKLISVNKNTFTIMDLEKLEDFCN